MRKNVDHLLVVLLSLFFIASIGLLTGVARQGQAVQMGSELAQAALANDDKLHTVLSRIDDLGKYRKISNQIITGRTRTLSGIADLSQILHANIRFLSFALAFSLLGLFAVGIVMYLRLRSLAQLVRGDG